MIKVVVFFLIVLTHSVKGRKFVPDEIDIVLVFVRILTTDYEFGDKEFIVRLNTTR